MSESDVFDEEFGDLLSGSFAEKDNSATVVRQEVPVAPTPMVAKPEKREPIVSVPGKPDLGDSVSSISFGARVSNVPIPRFKASKDSKARIAILSSNVQAVLFHYVKGMGSFLCMNDKCCEFEGLPNSRYLIPIVLYSVNKNGQIVDQSLELKCLMLGDEKYQALVDAVSFSGRDITDVDIIVTCSDEAYQKLAFAADASKGASWKSFESAKDIVKKYKENKDRLYMAAARKLSLESYLAKKGFVDPTLPASVGNFNNIDEVLDS